jgi:hypothetical protein
MQVSAYRSARVALVVSAAVILSGCWAPPSASIRPAGKPRVIAQGIEVDRIVDFAKVESLDPAARTVALSVGGVALPAYKLGRSVRNWGDVHSADHVRATIEELLTVYVEGNTLHVAAPSRPPDARVLVVDPSYRLLTVQYPDGGTETFKTALHTRMDGIQAGDSVAIREVEVTELHVWGHWHKGRSRPHRSVTSGR